MASNKVKINRSNRELEGKLTLKVIEQAWIISHFHTHTALSSHITFYK